jgi:enoyl-CoA hydratase/carnithine racemase
VVDLDTPVRPPAQAPGRPAVVVGTARDPVPDPPPACDVLVTDHPRPPRPWTGGGSDTLARLRQAVDRSPTAAVVLVQLLRLGPGLDPAQGLVAESLAYAALQDGEEHRRWLDAGGRPAPRSGPDRPRLRLARTGATLHITLQRPERRNAVDRALRDELFAALELAALDPSLTAVRLEADGPVFCAGGDLSEFGTVPTPAVGHLVRMARSLPGVALACAPKLCTVVQGAAVGAGLELAAFGRRVVATPDAVFRLPEVAMGLIPGAGGTVSVRRRIGRRRLSGLALTGEALGADTALDWGLVDEIARRPGTGP